MSDDKEKATWSDEEMRKRLGTIERAVFTSNAIVPYWLLMLVLILVCVLAMVARHTYLAALLALAAAGYASVRMEVVTAL